ncbi:MAG: Protein of unknown function (DUF1553)/Protein of unknown function (DUF1549)/Planctomycete [Phycisphaerales bacterium]|nr:Protein of unknown function (DUF1553)/Protein of unknown function (DUF1549)/Planctomycete [Phycisphaerales bacterium]
MTPRSLPLFASAIAVAALGFFALNRSPAAPAAAPAPVAAKDEIRFNRDIRPILSDSCFLCHGPDKNNRKAKLRLDDREVALSKGAIVPGDVEKSEAVRRLFTKDPDDMMPPPDSGRKITQAQKELLKKWIAAGAKYEPHWAYVTPVRPEIPATKDKAWVRNPIDAFILQALESKSIKPSTEADRRTLLRRLSLDLIGLPPTPAEVDAFVNDKSPDAYEKQVDRLLASPHYGERMAVGWLDLARFADTVGYHGDQNERNFPYRDYVINAFNTGKPFDQFTIEQLAGDLLPNPTTEQRVATGFNRQNMMTREGGAQAKEYLAKYMGDRVRTVSTTFLGSTMACCECHDHKFDPFSAKDFYALGAFFSDIKQWGVYMDYSYTPNPDLKGFSNDSPFPPEIQVDSPYLQRRQAKLRKQIDAIAAGAATKTANDPKLTAAFDDWCKTAHAFLSKSPTGWLTPPAEPLPAKAGSTPEAVVNADASVLFTGKMKKGDDQQISLTLPAGWISAIRLEALPHAKHKNSFSRDGGKSPTVTLAAAYTPKNSKAESRLAFYHADADHKEPRYANGFEVIGIQGGWRLSASSQSPQSALYLLEKPIKAAEGDKLVISIKSDNIGCVRLSVSPFASEDLLHSDRVANIATALQSPSAARSADQHTLLNTTYLLSTAHDPEAFAAYKPLHREILECRNGKAWTMVTEARPTPTTQRVLPRGNWQDDTGEIVQPAPPHFLSPIANPQSALGNAKRLTRLDLAKWLVAKENPLTARTFVNRLWKQFYGNGLSLVVDDLGAQGEPPSHPDLLDYLAVEFQSKWDVKQIVRLMVTSATYRQSASLRPELRDIDPNNRLLASQNPRRLDAEFVRDNALAIAGLLDPEIGGPSAHPYQPPGYYTNIQFPSRDYYPDADDRQYRRGLYTHWQRTFMHPMLANFDAPSREECTANRNLSNTPQQALTLLNDPSFVEAARVFATRLMASSAIQDDTILNQAFQQALLRPIKPKEQESLKKFLAQQREYYKANPEDAKKLTSVGIAPAPTNLDQSELAAWTTVCRVVLNLHESITRY